MWNWDRVTRATVPLHILLAQKSKKNIFTGSLKKLRSTKAFCHQPLKHMKHINLKCVKCEALTSHEDSEVRTLLVSEGFVFSFV